MGTLKALWILILAWILLFMQEGAAAQQFQSSSMYCNKKAPLTTEYIAPFYEEPRPAKGCVSLERHKENGFQVVVVRSNATSDNVLLILNVADISAKGVYIVLDSPVPVRWKLNFFGDGNGNDEDGNHEESVRYVVMSPGSSLARTNAKVKNLNHQYKDINVEPQMSNEKFGTLIRQYYGGLSILAHVIGANRVSLTLSDQNYNRKTSVSSMKKKLVPLECNLSSLVDLKNSVLAFYVHKQKMLGCYHPNLAGSDKTDVHMIDLMAAIPSSNLPLNDVDDENSAEDDLRFSRATPSNNQQMPAVFLSMTPKLSKSGSIVDNSPRDITLILKSFHPVKWYLESWEMKGALKVISTNGLSIVENYALSPGQNLSIVRKSLTTGDDFQQLWRTALEETGVRPMSYIKVKVANVLSMVIPPKNHTSDRPQVNNDNYHRPSFDEFSVQEDMKSSKSNFVPDPVTLDDAPVADFTIPLIPDKAMEKTRLTNAKIPMLEKDLEALIGKKCNQEETLITLPIESLAKFDVTDMTLNDAACRAEKNLTHWILKTKSTSCDSVISFNANNPIMRNEIHLKFSPQSELYGYLVRLRFTCKYAPGIFGFPMTDDTSDDDDLEYESSTDDDEDKEEMYTMQISRKRKRPLPSEILVSRKNDHAKVYVGDQLKVQTDLQTKFPVSLMIEKCWLGNHPNANEPRSLINPNWLIYEGCPLNENVTMFPVPIGTNPGFTFQITNAHSKMNQLYVFCLIGICTPNPGQSNGNIPKCVDPVKKCASDEWHTSPAAQQLSRRGPLYVTIPKHEVTPEKALQTESGSKHVYDQQDQEEELGSASLRSSHVVMVGVPAEIAVAISLASFLIGASLTGMLCCIHHRRAMSKTTHGRKYDGSDRIHENSELQSMIASPTLNGGVNHHLQTSTKLTTNSENA